VYVLNLVFKDYLGFLKDKGVDIEKYNLVEGYYWLDRSIIKCYDVEGRIHKVLRIHIDDELNITASDYKKEAYEIESWEETIERNKGRLEELENESINLIKSSIEKYKEYTPIIFTSSGKDSELTRYLVNKTLQTNSKLDIKSIIMFNNTSMDCSDTYKMIKTIPDCITISPKEGFYQKIKTVGIPTRHHRWCCSLYKEGATKEYLDDNKKYLFFYGMRNEESSTRSGYQDEKFDDRWGEREWMGILPIRKWTEEDVWLYTLKNNIVFNPKYKKGYSRVGCHLVCPYYTKSTWVLDKYFYPVMYERFQKFLKEDFIERQLWCAMNCTVKEYPLCWNGGAIRPKPNEEVIQECAEHKGIEIDIATKYFNKVCTCGNKITKNDVIAMNMKFLGRDVEQYLCKKCLRKFLKLSVEQWNTYIKDFKTDGCSLF